MSTKVKTIIVVKLVFLEKGRSSLNLNCSCSFIFLFSESLSGESYTVSAGLHKNQDTSSTGMYEGGATDSLFGCSFKTYRICFTTLKRKVAHLESYVLKTLSVEFRPLISDQKYFLKCQILRQTHVQRH